MTVEDQPAAAGGEVRGSLSARLGNELKAIALTALYFLCWIAALMLLKFLLLEDYGVQAGRLSVAVFGALVLSKVVLVLELVPLGSWVKTGPAWVDVVLRTVMYSLGVALVMLLEKGFEGRQEYDGFVPSLQSVFQHTDIHHVYVNIFCISGALLSFNVLSVMRCHLGGGSLFGLFIKPLPGESGAH